MGALVPDDDLPAPSRLVPADDLLDEPKAKPPASEREQRNAAGMRFLKGAGAMLLGMVKPGQYALSDSGKAASLLHPFTPQGPQPPRQTGEDDSAYATRMAHEGMRELGSAPGLARSMALLGYTMPGGGAANAEPRPLLQKSPQAQLLEAQGVKGMTTGQLVANPENSVIAALEKVTDKSALGMGPRREAVKKSWQVSEIAKSRKPGEAPLPQDVPAAVRESHARFDPEYEALGSHPVAPETVQGLPQRALDLPSEGIPDSVRKKAQGEITDALSASRKLKAASAPPVDPQPIAVSRSVEAAGAGERPPPAPSRQVLREDMRGREPEARSSVVPPVPETPPSQVLESSSMPRTYPGTNRPAPAAPGTQPEWKPVFQEQPPRPEVTTGDLIGARKFIRKAKRDAVNEPERLAALGHGESVLTDAINASLPDEAARAALRDADARYATLMRVEGAAPLGHTEFTPQQLLRKTDRASGGSAFAQGQAHGQESAEAARDVFGELAFTGGRPTVLSHLPWNDKWGVPATRILNMSPVQRFLFDTPRRLTAAAPPSASAGATSLAEALRRAKLVPEFQFRPAAADEEQGR